MSLYDLMDDPVNYSFEDKKPEIKNKEETMKLVSDMSYTESIEYLKYSNPYLHDKLIIANSEYKNKHKKLYDEFKHLKLIATSDRYKIEHYIKINYKLINTQIELLSEQLLKQHIITDPKKFFKMSILHGKINMLINIKDATIRGTLFDKALSYVYDNSIDFLTVARSCKTVEELSDIIINKKIISSEEMINELFGNQLEHVKIALDAEFANMKPCKIIYSHDTRTYGYPDFIADNWMIDVKTSKSSVINLKNYLQIIGYAICSGTRNICLYDIENGLLYKGTIKSNTYEKIKSML